MQPAINRSPEPYSYIRYIKYIVDIDVVNETYLDGAWAVRLGVIFIFYEFPLIANKNFFKNLLVLSSSLNYFCLKQTSWKFANTDN